MIKIHVDGEGVCGTFSHDVAQTKVTQVTEFSRNNEQPLMCVLRELSDK
jgi:ATP-dependent Clp protease adaptor protein ClpS